MSDDVVLAAQLGQQLLAQTAALEAQLQTATATIDAERERVRDTERLAERRLTALHECERSLQQSAAECDQLHAALAAAERQQRDSDQAMRLQADALRLALDDARKHAAECDALQTELAALHRTARGLQRTRSVTDASLDASAARSLAAADQLSEQLVAANGRVAHLEATLSDAAAEISSLRAALDGFGDATAELERLRDANADLVRRLDDSRAEAAALADHVAHITSSTLHQSLSQADLAADASNASGSVLDELRELMSSPGSVASPPPLVLSPSLPAVAPGAKSGELHMRLHRAGAAPGAPWAKRRVIVQSGALIFHGNAVEQLLGAAPADADQLPRQGVLALRGASVKLVPAGDGVVMMLGVRHMLLDPTSNEPVGATFRFYELRSLSDASSGADDSELLAWASALELAVSDAAPKPAAPAKPAAERSAAKATQSCVVLIENEVRLTPFHSWSPSETGGGLTAFVAGADVPHWTTKDGAESVPKERFECPAGRQWASDKWTLTEPPHTGSFVSETLARTDLHGWQYAPKWTTPPGVKWLPEPTAGSSVRRRFWKRNVVGATNQG